MTLAKNSQFSPSGSERYQHGGKSITAEQKAWLSAFNNGMKILGKVPAGNAGKSSEIIENTADASHRAERRLAPWKILAGHASAAAVDHAPGNEAQIQAIRSAIENNRTEFYLQPVVQLDDRKVKFYEGLTRLRDANGKIIMPATYLPIAERAGLGIRIDNMLLLRSINVIDSFIRKKYRLGIFCNFSKHALRNLGRFEPFKPYLAAETHLSSHLIFEFSQAVLDSFDEVELRNLKALARLGFRFSLDNITRLDMDFNKLFLQGFRYMKVDGDILRDGCDRAGMCFVTLSLAGEMRLAGLQLIAHKLETREMAEILLNYDIDLGQGYLYGKPRLIRPPAARPQKNMAATA